MGVEKFGKYDHEAIVADQKAAAEKEGRAYISAEARKALADKEEAIRKEFNAMRSANGRTAL